MCRLAPTPRSSIIVPGDMKVRPQFYVVVLTGECEAIVKFLGIVR
jgi:hypothetical protein